MPVDSFPRERRSLIAISPQCITSSGASGLEPNLRRLRCYLTVYECGSVQGAAKKLYLTQSSLTRAVQKLESQLGVALFDRNRRGMVHTAFGDILADRTRRALANLDAVEEELHAIEAGSSTAARWRGFSAKVTHRQLAALIGIADNHTAVGAGRQLALSQPAIAMALRDLESLVGSPLFLRSAHGMVATASGEIVLRRAKLAFSEISAASTDIAALAGAITGRVVVGVLPLSNALLAPRAVNLLLQDHPNLQVSLVDGCFDALEHGLLFGDIDMVIGAMRFPAPADVVQEYLFQDSLSVVARKGHPLAAREALSFDDLAGSEWVIPRSGTLLRRALDHGMKEAGVEFGSFPIESNSHQTIRAILMDSDRLGVVSRRQIYFEEREGMIAVLPVSLHGTDLPIGVRTRADAAPSVGVRVLLRHLHRVAADMDRTPCMADLE
jgi:LysR family transcriptional regulator of gallate degradation